MRFQVFKSNKSGDWYRGEVEASNAIRAESEARRLFPSKNGTDRFRVVEITPEIQADIDRRVGEDFVRFIGNRRRALERRGGLDVETYFEKCQRRIAAYRAKCIENGGTGR